MPTTNGQYDQCFILNDINYQMPPELQGNSFANFKGDFSYKSVWAQFYAEALVMGSQLRLRLSRPLYPNVLAAVNNNLSNNINGQFMQVPINAMHGFWYIRVYYTRAFEEFPRPADTVGHDVVVNDNTLWSNMRDFQADASVAWQRDKLPRSTKMGTLTDSSVQTTAGAKPTVGFGPPLYGLTPDGQPQLRTYYEVSLSNMPVKWRYSYSFKKHFQDFNALRNAYWSGIPRPGSTDVPAPVPTIRRFYVKFGYIAFDSTGLRCFCTPIDRIATRTVEAEIQYYVILREPRVTPFVPVTVPGGRALGHDIIPSAGVADDDEISPLPNLEGLEGIDHFTDFEFDSDDGAEGDTSPDPAQPEDELV